MLLLLLSSGVRLDSVLSVLESVEYLFLSRGVIARLLLGLEELKQSKKADSLGMKLPRCPDLAE